MFDRKVLKTRARFVLARSFLLSIVACLAVFVTSNVEVSVVNDNLLDVYQISNTGVYTHLMYGIMALLVLITIGISVFVSAPLNIGLKNFMLRSADMDVRLENLIAPFKHNYKKVVWVTFVRNLYVSLWSLLGLIPFAIGIWKFNLDKIIYQFLTIIMENYSLNMSGNSIAIPMEIKFTFRILMITTAIFMIPAYIKMLQYSMVDYILAENPNGKALEIIRKSKEMMVGNKWAYVKLAFSFYGWIILGSFVCCGLGIFAVMPYMEATYAQMYLEISGQGKDYGAFDYRTDFQNPFGGF